MKQSRQKKNRQKKYQKLLIIQNFLSLGLILLNTYVYMAQTVTFNMFLPLVSCLLMAITIFADNSHNVVIRLIGTKQTAFIILLIVTLLTICDIIFSAIIYF